MTRPGNHEARRRRGVFAFLILCAMAAATGPTRAQTLPSEEPEEMTLALRDGEARLASVTDPFDTVVVGDPTIVTTSVVSATALVLTARSRGRTNIILLDSDGAVQAQWSVIVGEGHGHRATIYRGVEQIFMTCIKECRPSIDDLDLGNP